MTAKSVAIFIATTVMLLIPPVQAGPAAIKKSMAKIIPNVPITSIKPSAITGLFEVRVGAEVYYLTSDGRFLVSGDIIDMKSRQNLSANARGQVRLDLVNAVSVDKMITYKPEKTIPVSEHFALAGRVSIRGTPTLIMDDGQVLPGYAPPDKLFAMLGIGSNKLTAEK